MNPDARGTDVVIIGDGVIGLSTALELARASATCNQWPGRGRGAVSLVRLSAHAPDVGEHPSGNP